MEILCCPEAVLGGLDCAERPADFAIDADRGQLNAVLSPLGSDPVTTIVGFTQIAGGRLCNAAAVFHPGAVVSVYRTVHPAIRRSVYPPRRPQPGLPGGGLTFGILICNDSNFPELARSLASQRATALFIPTSNGLPPERADVVEDARRVHVALARENGVSVIRADVAGRADGRVSYGSSAIVGPDGTILEFAKRFTEVVRVADLDITPIPTISISPLAT